MKYTHFALVLTSAIALAACGGSSGGSDHTTPDSDSFKKFTAKTTGTTSGIYMPHEAKEGEKTEITSSDNIDTLVINGKHIHFLQDRDNDIIDRFDYVRAGFIENQDINKASYLFVQGIPTENMPMTGKAEYEGYATFASQHSDSTGMLHAHFSVNFADKSLDGKIVGSDANLVALKAKIDGNSFSGQHNGIQTAGQFYGNNAEELGGIYFNKSKGFGGAFAAGKID